MSLSGLFAKIYSDIINEKLSIPAMPDVVLRLQGLIQEGNYTMYTLGRVVQLDVGLSAYLINIANSPVYRTRVKAVDVESALRLIGVKAFSNLISSYAIRSMVDKREMAARPLFRDVWKASAYRAAIAAAISRQLQGIDENRALLAGLLQDIGLFALLMKIPADKLANKSANQAALADLTKYGVKVGVIIAKKWQLDEELINVIRQSGNYAYVGEPPIDLIDVANIARLLSKIGKKQVQWPRLEEAPCLTRLSGEGLTYEKALALIAEARQEIQVISQVLVGHL